MREALEQWDGSTESATDLRGRFRHSPIAEGRVDTGDRGLAKFRRAYDSNANPKALLRWLVRNPEELEPVAPLLGDPALGTWPWSDPFGVEDELALVTLEILARVRVLPDPSIRAFLRVLLRVRPRPLWTAAARAMAHQARHDETLQDTIQALWREAFPESIALGGPETRLRRHALFLGASHIAEGGELPGPDPRELATRALPKDEADRSVVLQCLVQLRDDPAVAPHIRDVLSDRKHGPLSERTIVGAFDLLSPELREVVKATLAISRWRDADGLLAWADSVRTLDLRDLEAGPAARAIALALDPRGRGNDVVELLREALDPVSSPLVPPRRLACALAEAVALLEAPDIRDIPWPDIAAAAGDFVVALPGRACEVGPQAIGVSTALIRRPVEHLLRTGDLGVEGMFCISSLDNPFVATQVAVQMESCLRRAPDDSERLRLLWRLLQTDPPSRTFEELDDMLRADARPGASASSPLIEIGRAVESLYHHRMDSESTHAQLAEAMRELASRLDALDISHRPPLRLLADLVECPPAERVNRLAKLLSGEEGALLPWTAWVEGASPYVLAQRLIESAAATEDLRAAQSNLDAARPLVEATHATEARRASERALESIGRCGWPERHAINFVLTRFQEQSREDLHTGHLARASARELEDALRVGDEDSVRARIDQPAFLALLTSADLVRVHRFLLDQMDWWGAERFRRTVRARTALPSLVSHFLPMIAAIAGGALLVQDFGTTWVDNAVREEGLSMEHQTTVALAVGMAWLTLTGTLARRFHSPNSSLRMLAGIVVRSFPVLITAGCAAATANAAVLWTLRQLDFESAIVGGALSLFLGVFVGLVLPSQGQSRD